MAQVMAMVGESGTLHMAGSTTNAVVYRKRGIREKHFAQFKSRFGDPVVFNGVNWWREMAWRSESVKYLYGLFRTGKGNEDEQEDDIGFFAKHGSQIMDEVCFIKLHKLPAKCREAIIFMFRHNYISFHSSIPVQHQFPMRYPFLSIFFVLNFFFGAILPVRAQKNDRQLQIKVEELLKGFNGQIGVYVKSLKSGKTVAYNADTSFPTASIVKVPILVGIMKKIEAKELAYDQKLVWQDTLGYDPGEDIAAYLKPGTKIALSKVMMLMMTISDNNASLWLQSIAGGGSTINSLMNEYGYTKTRVNSRTPGREDMRSVYGWGQSTPREMAQLFEDIVNRKLISARSSERMLRIMGRQYWDGEALSALPPDVFVASKNGAVNASRDEVLYVNGKHPYILSIFTKNNKDISWEDNNEAWELTRRLSKLVWEHFNK